MVEIRSEANATRHGVLFIPDAVCPVQCAHALVPLFLTILAEIGGGECCRVMISPGQDFVSENFTVAAVGYQIPC